MVPSVICQNTSQTIPPLSSLFNQVNEHTSYEHLTETTPYDDGFGRVLAQNTRSSVNVPSISKSHMDGYAVRSTDTSKASPLELVSLHLAGSVPLGTHTRPSLSTGQAIRVPTGGFLPRGTDAVVMVEKAEIQGDDVILREPVLKGQHVHARGEDIKDKISSGLGRADMVMTIGGSSVGEADLVSQVIDYLGSPGVVVHGVKLDLGRVTGCGVVRGKAIVVLPGLIGSTLNAFIAIGLPLIRRMAGFRREDSFGVEARLTKDRVVREKYGDFLKISYVRLFREAGGFVAKPLEAQATDVGVFTEANGFFIASEDTLRVNEGEAVMVEFLPGFSFPKSQFFPDMPYLD